MNDLYLPQEIVLQTAQIISVTEAEGPGRRLALWFQGCPLRCQGCCNPEMLPFAGGTNIYLSAMVKQVRAVQAEHGIEGITLLGGEPFAHARAAAGLARSAHTLNLSVMIFSGYMLEALRQSVDAMVQELLAQTDILVDGPYERDRPENRRRWIGSTNQRVHFLSSRCDPDDPRWLLPNTLEIRLHCGELTVNGFPARHALGLWQRPGTIARGKSP